MIHHGDCLDVMPTLDAESIDAVVCDPPYGLEFMGKEWDRLDWRDGGGFSKPGIGDRPTAWASFGGETANATCATCGGRMRGKRKCECAEPDWRVKGAAMTDRAATRSRQMQAWHEAWAREALRVAKPGAYLLAFGGTRTVHRLACAIEDAGWIIRDMLVWGYACLSDDTEVLTSEGWVRYNSARDGQLAAAFDPATGDIRWNPILAVHQYDHDGAMAEVGPSLVTLNHRIVLDAETARVPRVPGLWDYVRSSSGVASEGGNAGLLAGVQRQVAHPRPAVPAWPGVVGGATATAVRSDDRPGEPRLEGRRYRVQEAWDVLGCALRASAGVGTPDGPFGRLPDGASLAYRRGVRLPADPDGMREPREPRPDGQPAREPDALAGQPDAQTLRMGQVPGGHGEPDQVRLVDGYRGVVWCITVGTGAFVARRNGQVFVTGNSGFPKSKASLKPAWEPIVMARKPGPLRELAIDACRIGFASDADRDGAAALQELRTKHPGGAPTYGAGKGMPAPTKVGVAPSGRWPANIVLTDPIFDGGWDGVVGGGETAVAPPYRITAEHVDRAAFPVSGNGPLYGDSGTYSRFFLVPKSSRSDREPVLGGLANAMSTAMVPAGGNVVFRCLDCGRTHPNGDRGRRTECAQCGGPNLATSPAAMDGTGRSRHPGRANHHPTVKPTELMRHLVRLVTPPGGIVLDPFLGSGTTALAAEMEGFGWVGIEREEEYVRIAEARLNGTQRGMAL